MKIFHLALLLVSGCGRTTLDDPPGFAGGAEATGGGPQAGEAQGANSSQGGGGEAPCVPVVCDPTFVASAPEVLLHTVYSVAQGTCGGVAVASAASGDAYLRLFDAAGTPVWKQTLAPFDDPSFRSATAVFESGDVIYASSFDAPFFSIGDHLIVNDHDAEEIVVVRFRSDGSLQWARTFGSSGRDRPSSVMALPDGGFLLGGRTDQSVDLGGGPLSGAFLARLSAEGEHVWSYSFASNGDGADQFMAADNGDILMLARVRGQVQVPGGSPFEAGMFSNVAFLARIRSDGSHVFSKLFGDSSSEAFVLPAWPDNGLSFGPGPGGGLRMVTAMAGTLDFGGGEVEIGNYPLQYGIVAVDLTADGSFIEATNVIPDPDELADNMGPNDHAITSAARPSQVLLGLGSNLLTAAGGAVVATLSLGGIIASDAPPVQLAPIEGGSLIAKHVQGSVQFAGQTVPAQSLLVAHVCDP